MGENWFSFWSIFPYNSDNGLLGGWLKSVGAWSESYQPSFIKWMTYYTVFNKTNMGVLDESQVSCLDWNFHSSTAVNSFFKSLKTQPKMLPSIWLGHESETRSEIYINKVMLMPSFFHLFLHLLSLDRVGHGEQVFDLSLTALGFHFFFFFHCFMDSFDSSKSSQVINFF